MYQPSKITDLLPSKPSFFPEPDDTGRILLEAANLIRTHGWAKGDFENSYGEMCLHGAINKATVGKSAPFGASGYGGAPHCRIAGYLLSIGAPGSDGDWAADWNNDHAKSPTEVIDALEAAAFYSEPVPA